MTAAVSTCEDTRPDWVVAGELMAGRTPATPPTSADGRLAAWLLLDRGESPHAISARTGLPVRAVRGVARLWARAQLPEVDEAVRAALPLARRPLSDDERAELEPTEFERWILSTMGWR